MSSTIEVHGLDRLYAVLKATALCNRRDNAALPPVRIWSDDYSIRAAATNSFVIAETWVEAVCVEPFDVCIPRDALVEAAKQRQPKRHVLHIWQDSSRFRVVQSAATTHASGELSAEPSRTENWRELHAPQTCDPEAVADTWLAPQFAERIGPFFRACEEPAVKVTASTERYGRLFEGQWGTAMLVMPVRVK
jgi:hypothetical protein